MTPSAAPRCYALCAVALLLLAACDEQANAPSPDPGGQASGQAPTPATTAAAAASAAEASGAASAAEASGAASAAEASGAASAEASAEAAVEDSAKARAEGSAKAGAGSSASAEAVASASAAPEEPEGKVKGKEASEGTYSTWLQSAGRYVVGKPASVQAVLVAKGGFHCNDKYPYKFKLNAAPDGVSYPDAVARGISLGKQRSVLTVPFTPSSAGAKTISGTFFFSVCDDTACHIKKAPMSVTVEVNES